MKKTFDEKTVTFNLVDTEDRYQLLAYNNVKAFIVAYSIENVSSLNSIRDKWMPELQKISTWPIPFVLVGMNSVYFKAHLTKKNTFYCYFSYENRLKE